MAIEIHPPMGMYRTCAWCKKDLPKGREFINGVWSVESMTGQWVDVHKECHQDHQNRYVAPRRATA